MLFVCGTPIGNLDDVTLRVLQTLRSVSLIAAEDTRRTRKLLAHFDIHTPLTSLFAHNEAQKTAFVLGLLREGADVALVTDAGMPGVSDPGARLIAAVVREGLPLTVLPGPSAVVTALVAAGFATEAGFRFVGYLPRRLSKSLRELAAVAPGLPGAVCRELTKVHEEVVRGTVAELAEHFASEVRGEVTLVFDLGAPTAARGANEAASAAAALVARGLSRRDAAAALAACLGLPHNEAHRLVAEAAPDGERR